MSEINEALHKEVEARKPLIIAVDFDGTLCRHKFPEIGEPIPQIINLIKEHKTMGDKIILWTCRSGEHLAKAVEWCGEQGIYFDAVNEDIEEIRTGDMTDFGGSKSVKVYADIYVDDRNAVLRKASTGENLN